MGWGPKNPEAQTEQIVDDFHVVFVKKSADSDGNEDALIALCVAVEAAISEDHTLSGTS